MNEIELLSAILNRLELIYTCQLVGISAVVAVGVSYLLYRALHNFF